MNHFIKTLLFDLSDDKKCTTQDTLWRSYNDFNNKKDPFVGDEFIFGKIDIQDGNSPLCQKKHYLP